jgi:hypothetical protein
MEFHHLRNWLQNNGALKIRWWRTPPRRYLPIKNLLLIIYGEAESFFIIFVGVTASLRASFTMSGISIIFLFSLVMPPLVATRFWNSYSIAPTRLKLRAEKTSTLRRYDLQCASLIIDLQWAYFSIEIRVDLGTDLNFLSIVGRYRTQGHWLTKLPS